MFSRISNTISKKRSFSCSYSYNKPIMSPFMSSLICGSIFTSLILSRIHSNDVQLMAKMYELEKDIKDIKNTKNKDI